MAEASKMKVFLKGFLWGFLLIPAAIGLLVIFHVLIDGKNDGRGGELTNRIARAELVWLAMSRPKLFCDSFEWVCEDVKERHEKERSGDRK